MWGWLTNRIKKRIDTEKVKEKFSSTTIREKKTTLSRFTFTSIMYYRSKLIKNTISENTHITLVFLYLLFLIFYFLIPPINNAASDETKQFFDEALTSGGFKGFGDETIRYIIITVTSSLALVLSILSAMYVFTHREQKTISPSVSNVTRKNGLVVFVVLMVIFSMITGYTLSANMDSLMKQEEYANQHPLHVTNVLFYKICAWIAIIISATTFVVELIRYLFISMNPDKMLKNSIMQIAKNLNILTGFYTRKKFNNLLIELYKTFHHNIESIFQNLKFLGDHNMNKDFDENVAALSEIIKKLKGGNSRYDVENVASHLLERDGLHFVGIYNSLLRNTLSLLIHLYKNNHFNKGKELTRLYFLMFLDGEDSLKQHFTLSLNEFLDSLDTSNERQLRDFLNGLKNLPEDSTLIIYKNLIQKLVVKKNAEMLTTVVYDFKEHIIDGKTKRPKAIVKPMFKAIAAQNQKNLKKSAIVILLQSLVKAIEVSHYGTVGFLVKYLVTNFTGEEINNAYQRLKQAPLSFTTIFESIDEPDNVSDENTEIGLIGINIETFDYCCKKMVILLYGQQKYVIKEALWFVEDDDSFKTFIEMDNEFENCPYSSYIFKKIESSSTKYGLLFFKDKEIMKDIRDKLKLKSLDESDGKSPSESSSLEV